MHSRFIGPLLALGIALMANAGIARTIEFAGQTWEVRAWGGNPGTGCWNGEPESVWIDDAGNLHLKIRKVNGFWCQAEVRALTLASYGHHQFQVISKLDELDPELVFGMFLYGGDDREIDIEVTDSLDPTSNRGSFAIHGDGGAVARFSFPLVLSGSYSTHNIRWTSSGISLSSWHGHCAAPPCGGVIASWDYDGALMPLESDNLCPIINLWINHGATPAREQEIIVKGYQTIPLRRRAVRR